MLPFTGYAVLCGAALKLQTHPTGALFLIGGATLLLVFIGIHNAWDTVVWIATQGVQRNKAESKE
jgi:phosphotransferase system  glucose/maltose/N-acetylglucosamine-specific IIC component